MQKKPYTPPAVTEHGDAVKKTQGMGGRYWEMYNPKSMPDLEEPPILTDDASPSSDGQ